MSAAFGRRFRGASAGYLLIAPAVIVTVVFLVIPMIVSGYWSLTHYNGIKPPEFVGLQNYADVLANPRFQRAFQNTVFFVVMGMAIGPLLGLGSAILLNDNLRLRALFRTSFFLPTMTSLDRGRHDLEADVRGQRDRQRRGLGLRAAGPRLADRSDHGPAGRRGHRDLAGLRVRDGGLPRGAPGRSRASTTRRPRSTARAAGRSSAG